MITNFVKKFIYSDVYLILLCLVSFMAWQTKMDVVGMAIMAFVFCIVMCFSDDGTPAIPALAWFMLTISHNYDFDFIINNVVVLIVIATGVFGSIAVFLCKNKVRFRFGKQFAGFLAMFVAMSLGGILFNPSLTLKSIPSVFTIYFCLIAGYLLFLNVVRRNCPKYFAKIMTYTGLLLALQTLNFYLTSEYSFQTLIEFKLLKVGWGVSNSIGALLVLIVPFTFYLVAKVKLPILYIGLLAVEIVALLMTLSRGAILFAALGFPLGVVFTCMKAESKKTVLTCFMYLIVVGVALIVLKYNDISFIFDKISGTDSSGRFDLYFNAIEDFCESPIFGISMYGRRSRVDTNLFAVVWYHSTPMQFMANAGLAGLLAYLVHLFFKYEMLFSKGDVFVKFVLLGILMWSGYALIDAFYFTQNQLVFFALSLVFAEKNVYNNGGIGKFLSNSIKKNKINNR